MTRKHLIPNYISGVRIILAFVICTIFLFTPLASVAYHWTIPSWNLSFDIPSTIVAGTILFIIASSTDWLDGYLARKYHWVSDFGKLLDPIADKILITTTMIIFASYSGVISLWMVILIIVRDLMVDAIRIYAQKKAVVLAANYWGKYKTVCQIIGIVLVGLIFYHPINTYQITNFWFYYLVQNGFILLSVLLAWIAFVQYAVLAYQRIFLVCTEK